MDEEYEEEFKIFITHGRSELWKDVARYIEKDLNVNTVELSEAPNRGRTIIQKLDEESDDCHFAIVILSAEDEMSSGSLRARQNVVHEIGFFQGKFGLDKVVFLKEEGVEWFSNIEGVVYEEFNKGYIRSTFPRIQKEIEHALEEWELESDNE